MRRNLCASVLVAFSVVSASSFVLAADKAKRSPEDCAAAWGKAVRSYGKETKTPTPDDKEFAGACDLESTGDKAGARLEAIRVGVVALAKQDGDGCVRFLTSYIGAKDPKAVCDLATGEDEAGLKKAITENLPAAPKPKSK